MSRALWVLHRGALGDSVLLWPLMRGARTRGRTVVLVTDGAKARLAAAELGITGLDAEQVCFNRLWIEGAAIEPVEDAARVVAFAGRGAPDRVWLQNVGRMFPGARVSAVCRRPDARWARRTGGGAGVRVRANPRGPVVVHVGAGAETKRWAMAQWAEVVRGVRPPVSVIAGEVEAERLRGEERGHFERMGGRFIEDLGSLAGLLKQARAYAGCDSGPSHLAAQLGVPTVAVFGPTDPARWSPVGPGVEVVRAPGGVLGRLGARPVLQALERAAR